MNAEHKGPKINKKSSPTKWIVGGIALVLVVIAAIAIVGGGSDKGADSADSATSVASGGSVAFDGSGESATKAAEYQPVTFTGTALSALEDSVPAAGTDPAVGTPAPVLKGFSFNGMEMTIKASGKPMLLVFLAHWCPHCNAEIPRLIEWKASGDLPETVQVIGITTGSRDDQANWPPSEWIVNMEWPWPVMADSETQEAALAMGVSGYPGLVLIGGDGKVLARRSGEASISELNDWLAAAIPGA
jgi:cytochrome c biogenesis protein CcmG, thiol:disulfide interchange protein DsbE